MTTETISRSDSSTENVPERRTDVIGFIPPVRGVAEIFKFTLHTIGFVLVLIPAISLANVCQVLSLLVYPFSKRLFRVINYNLAGGWWYLLVHWMYRVQGLKVTQTGDAIPFGAQAMVVCNHQTMPDIPVLLTLSEKSGCVGGMRFFVKHALKYTPFIGWGMLFLDMIFVKRAWAKDRDFIYKMFANLRTYTLPIWVINYSEGTRSTPAKIKRSQEFARKSGQPVLENLMLPRPKGFVETMNNLRDKFDYVFDVTIGYTGGRPRLTDLMGGRLQDVHIQVRCFKAADLPEGDEALSEWLIQRFQLKDRLMGEFARENKFTSIDQ